MEISLRLIPNIIYSILYFWFNGVVCGMGGIGEETRVGIRILEIQPGFESREHVDL